MILISFSDTSNNDSTVPSNKKLQSTTSDDQCKEILIHHEGNLCGKSEKSKSDTKLEECSKISLTPNASENLDKATKPHENLKGASGVDQTEKAESISEGLFIID